MEDRSTLDFIYTLFIGGLSAFGLFFVSAMMVFKNFFPKQYYKFFNKEGFLSDREEDALDALLKQKYSALELGPFTAEMRRKTAVTPSFNTSEHDDHLIGSDRITLMTTIVARVKPARNCAFTVDVPRAISLSPEGATREAALKSLRITCDNDELRQFLTSDEFLRIVFKLHSLAPGSIQCVGDTFRVELNRTLTSEQDLDAFWRLAKKAFIKYAQQLQLYLPEWRDYDWWNEVEADADTLQTAVDRSNPALPEG